MLVLQEVRRARTAAESRLLSLLQLLLRPPPLSQPFHSSPANPDCLLHQLSVPTFCPQASLCLLFLMPEKTHTAIWLFRERLWWPLSWTSTWLARGGVEFSSRLPLETRSVVASQVVFSSLCFLFYSFCSLTSISWDLHRNYKPVLGPG